jgi:hypothetical protein
MRIIINTSHYLINERPIRSALGCVKVIKTSGLLLAQLETGCEHIDIKLYNKVCSGLCVVLSYRSLLCGCNGWDGLLELTV